MRRALVLALVFTAGCFYDPKADIEEFRPAAEKHLAAIEKVAKAVTALPPLTADTMEFPTPAELDFNTNAKIEHLEHITPPLDGTKIFDRVVSGEFFLAPMRLLKEGKDPHISDMDKEKVGWRFHQLIDVKYVVVLKIVKRVYPKMSDTSHFTPGLIEGEAHLAEITDAAKTFGGFRWAVSSSEHLSTKVRKDRESADLYNALRSDMDTKAAQQIHEKLKAALPGATPSRYW